MEKIDYKKTYKELYVPTATPSIINVPKMKFITIEWQGDPNGEEFAQHVAALYSLSYAVKMSYKSKNSPEGYYEYVVFPLEGEWDLVDKARGISDKRNYKYKLMIRQPEFLNNTMFESFKDEVKIKKPNIYLDNIVFEEVEEGLCCQMMHIGSYDSETQSFELMKGYCKLNGYKRILRTHREIYLKDSRKTEKEKLKTVLRFKVEDEDNDRT